MKPNIVLLLLLPFLLVLSMNQSPAAADPLPPVQILIDVGHGGVDPGTSYHSVQEKEINLRVGRMLYQLLADAGYRVILNRDRDQALSDDNRWLNSASRHKRDLAQRRQLAKELSPQMMISLHVNWSSDAGRRGPNLLYQANHQSFLLADIMQHALNPLFGTRDEPAKGRTYYLLRHDYCPTVIVEMGFLSNASDRAMLTSHEGQRNIARAIASGVSEYLLLVGELKQENASEETWIQKLRRIFRRHP